MRLDSSTIALATMVMGFALLPLGLLAHTWTVRRDLPTRPELVWGEQGVSKGRLLKPRAMAIDANDQIYIVDMTARIQVFDRDGNFLRGWRTPQWENGKPTGLSLDHMGNLLVADTHYYRVLTYTPTGELLEHRTIGGQTGNGPGEFGFVTDAVHDSTGCLYISEYGANDRIQKFSPDGIFLFAWGGHGSEPGQFQRPQSMQVDVHDRIWVADACNHRIQVFDATGAQAILLLSFGSDGSAPGQFRYPYGLLLDGDGFVYVSEFGNHRIQKFTTDGTFVSAWGQGGRTPGQLHGPWALVKDSDGYLHILDTYNHRVQRVRF